MSINLITCDTLSTAELTINSSTQRLPPELLFDVLEIALADHVHGYMVSDEQPEWDALQILLQIDSVWRDIAGKIISASLGIDRDESGNLTSNPWHPLRVVHSWGVQSRGSGPGATLVFGALLAEHEFLKRSLILRAYLLCLSTSSRMRSASNLTDLWKLVPLSDAPSVISITKDFIAVPYSRQIDKICHLIIPDVLLPIRCRILASWIMCLTHLLDSLEGVRADGNLSSDRIESLVGESQIDYRKRVAEIETSCDLSGGLDMYADVLFPLSKDHVKQIIEPKMAEIELRLDDVTDEEDRALRIREIWTQVSRVTKWTSIKNSPGPITEPAVLMDL